MVEHLDVYMRDIRVGSLSRENGRLTFEYDRQWLASSERHPISLSLPLRESPFADAETRTWFGNLLPEGDVLKVSRKIELVKE
jgi:serine/threonine-protein kinase HipA